MALREREVAPVDAAPAVAAAEAPQTVLAETELGLNEPIQINDDVMVMLALRVRPRYGEGVSLDKRIVVAWPASEKVYLRRSPEGLPALSAEPVSLAKGFRSRHIFVGRNDTVVQIGGSYRLTVHRPLASDGAHVRDRLIIKAESLRPLQFKVPDLVPVR